MNESNNYFVYTVDFNFNFLKIFWSRQFKLFVMWYRCAFKTFWGETKCLERFRQLKRGIYDKVDVVLLWMILNQCINRIIT